MQAITTIGLDIAKSVFQVHCVDVHGNVVLRRQLKRRYVLIFFQKLPPCLIAHWLFATCCIAAELWSLRSEADISERFARQIYECAADETRTARRDRRFGGARSPTMVSAGRSSKALPSCCRVACLPV
jgi:hypothetical protein